MDCRNCGEPVEHDEDLEDEDDDFEDDSEEEEVTYRGFCSEECCQEYMAKIMLVAELSQM